MILNKRPVLISEFSLLGRKELGSITSALPLIKKSSLCRGVGLWEEELQSGLKSPIYCFSVIIHLHSGLTNIENA